MPNKASVADIEPHLSGAAWTERVTLTIFSTAEGNRSVGRYAHELAESLAPFAETRIAEPAVRGAFLSKAADKLRFLRQARSLAGDANVIVSVGYAFLLLALDGERTVCVCHDLHPLMFPGRNWRERLLFRINLRLLNRTRAVVAVSEHTRQQLLRYPPWLQPQRIVTIHNGLHPRWRTVTDASRLEDFRRLHGLESGNFILHVGNDNWYKNFSALLRAFVAIEDRTLILVKVGRLGPDEQRLIAHLKIEDRVILLHALTDEELVLLYNCAEMLVFPSLHEGFGWPPLEAMACGCPVIAGDRASLLEVCGEAALYVNPEKPSEIATAITRLRSNPQLRRQLKDKGVEQAGKYDWKRTAESILELFET